MAPLGSIDFSIKLVFLPGILLNCIPNGPFITFISIKFDALADVDTPDATLNKDRLEAAIYETIEHLPEELKTAIRLREFDGLSYEDIAQIMGCPVGTVRSRIFRARDAIEKRIRPFMGGGE